MRAADQSFWPSRIIPVAQARELRLELCALQHLDAFIDVRPLIDLLAEEGEKKEGCHKWVGALLSGHDSGGLN